MTCMIEGCDIQNPLRVCEKHWAEMSELRRHQWARESNWGQYEPTKTLVDQVNSELKHETVTPCRVPEARPEA